MKKYKSIAMKTAYKMAGYRERYAMENGNKTIIHTYDGHTLFKFTYSRYNKYQDANGATYDATAKQWIY